MENEYIKERYKDSIINYYNKKGIDFVPELCVLNGVPLVIGYEIVMEYTSIQSDKDLCRFKIDYLNKFYRG